MAAWIVLAAPPSDPRPVTVEEATAAYANEDYAAAAQAFESLFTVDPQPNYLFAWAQSERLRGRCDLAVPVYRKFLETNPGERQVEATHELLAECGATAEPTAEPTPAPVADPAPPEPAPEREPPPPERPSPTGPILVGVGAGVAVVGGALLVGAGVRQGQLDGAEDYQSFADLYDEDTGRAKGVRPLTISGAVALSAGIGLGVAGAVLWARRGDERRVTVLPTTDARSASVQVVGRF